jgi:hypothetical protein
MTAFNVVRFRVKPGRDENFLEAHRRRKLEWSGMRRVTIIKTGERSCCFIGEWDSIQAIGYSAPAYDRDARYLSAIRLKTSAAGLASPILSPVRWCSNGRLESRRMEMTPHRAIPACNSPSRPLLPALG